jgi:hypothetical protein
MPDGFACERYIVSSRIDPRDPDAVTGGDQRAAEASRAAADVERVLAVPDPGKAQEGGSQPGAPPPHELLVARSVAIAHPAVPCSAPLPAAMGARARKPQRLLAGERGASVMAIFNRSLE